MAHFKIPISTRAAWVTFGVGCFLTLVVAALVKQAIDRDAIRQFAFTCDQVTLKIKERLDAYALILQGGAGLFAGSREVDRTGWRGYVETLQAQGRVPGIQGIGFAQLIRPDELDRHIAKVRAEGYADYSVRPPGERPDYSSIIFLEPFRDRNLRAFGYDMLSEPTRRAAMEQARDTGKPSLSARVHLIQEVGQQAQAGTLMYFPVYRNGAAVSSVEERRSALIGWTYSPYRMTDLMLGMLSDWTSHEGAIVDLHIFDGALSSPQALMFDSKPEHAPNTQSPFYQERLIDFHGRTWTLAFDSAEGNASVSYATAWAALFGGIILSSLLCSLILSFANTQAQARKLAQTLTEDLRKQQAALRDSEAQFHSMFESNQSVMLLLDPKTGRIVDANPAAAVFYGYSIDDLKSMNIVQINMLSPDEIAKLRAKAAEKAQNFFEFPHRLRSGEIRTVEVRSSPITVNHIVSLFSIVIDVTERKAMEEQIRQLAFFDPLTGLPNRRLLIDRLKQTMSNSKRNDSHGALMFIDLDNFKPINDRYGHATGDELLIRVAQRLKGCVREIDTVSRLGGDEFVVLVSDLDQDLDVSTGLARSIAEKISASLSAPHRLAVPIQGAPDAEVEHQCTASIGVAVVYGHDVGADDLFAQADAAMYAAKMAGRNAIRFFEPVQVVGQPA